ncbi:MAG: tetratricopeptide repeat protein [Rickettsiales bacterium]|nr:tetratricopeptide repeat protein [Rickettsiales bacterium]
MKKTVALLGLILLAGCGPQAASEGPLSDRERSLIHLADTMRSGGDVDSAIDLYKRAMAKSKHQVEAHLALADLYLQLERNSDAQEVLLTAKKRQPKAALVNLGLAKLAVNRGETQEAIGYFNDGLEGTPNHLDLLSGKAVSLDMEGQHDAAQALYFKALDTTSESAEFVQSNLAMSYIMNGQYDEAIAQLTAIDTMEKSAVMRQNLALAYGLKGQMKKARKWGLKDLSKKEFEQNIKFYKNYTKEMRAHNK